MPPLTDPIIQPRTLSGVDRRDAVFPNRNVRADNNWGHLYKELDARMILVEFKNYDREEIGKDDINQTRNYLTKAMGRLALICCNYVPNQSAHIKRNTIYSNERKVILFLTRDALCGMLTVKERGGDPSDAIVEQLEKFYLQHE